MEAAGPGKIAKWEQAEVVDVSIPTFVLAISIVFFCLLTSLGRLANKVEHQTTADDIKVVQRVAG